MEREQILKKFKGRDLDQVYEDLSEKLSLNYYKSVEGDYYVELGRYVDKISGGSVSEGQILKNKCAIDKNKMLKLRDLEVEKKFGYNHLTDGKKLVSMEGIQTINDSIKRYTKGELSDNFENWSELCCLMISLIPLQIEKSVQRSLKKELRKRDKIIESHQFRIDSLEEEQDGLRQENEQMRKEIKEMKKKYNKFEKILRDLQN